MTNVEVKPDFYTEFARRLGVDRTRAREVAQNLMYSAAGAAGIIRKTHFEMVAEFHEKFGLTYQDQPRQLDEEIGLFRIGFMVEELAEYAEASGYESLAEDLENIQKKCRERLYSITREQITIEDFEKQMDSLIDLDYVLSGTAYLHGFKHDEGYKRVHEANMKKVRVDAKSLDGSVRKSKYDVVKPDGWRPAPLKDLL